jgi:hypothetical protein
MSKFPSKDVGWNGREGGWMVFFFREKECGGRWKWSLQEERWMRV